MINKINLYLAFDFLIEINIITDSNNINLKNMSNHMDLIKCITIKRGQAFSNNGLI